MKRTTVGYIVLLLILGVSIISTLLTFTYFHQHDLWASCAHRDDTRTVIRDLVDEVADRVSSPNSARELRAIASEIPDPECGEEPQHAIVRLYEIVG